MVKHRRGHSVYECPFSYSRYPLDFQIDNMKKRLSSIVKEHHFDSVQAFYKELNVTKKENQDYESAWVEYEKTYGEEAVNTRSVRERIQQKEQIVKDKELGRENPAKQKR